MADANRRLSVFLSLKATCNSAIKCCHHTKQSYIKNIFIVFLETVFIKFHEIITVTITSSSVQNNRGQDKSYQPQPLASVDIYSGYHKKTQSNK